MLVSIFLTVIFKSPFLKSMQMAGKHKFVAYSSILEGVVNIVLSVILVKRMGVVGVAYGTIFPSAIMSIFIFFPVAALPPPWPFFFHFQISQQAACAVLPGIAARYNPSACHEGFRARTKTPPP
jgi:Na+-driven multidrug efflux pump